MFTIWTQRPGDFYFELWVPHLTQVAFRDLLVFKIQSFFKSHQLPDLLHRPSTFVSFCH